MTKRREPRLDTPKQCQSSLNWGLTSDDRLISRKNSPARRRSPYILEEQKIEPTIYVPGSYLDVKVGIDKFQSSDIEKKRSSLNKTYQKKIDQKDHSSDRWALSGLIRRLFYWAMVTVIWGGISLVSVIVWYGVRLPPTTEWVVPNRPPNIQIVALDGSVLANRGDTKGEAVKLSELPPHLAAAVISTEDRRFYSHFGLDFIGLVRAFIINVLNRGVSQGGSTLTQQLAKNLFLTQERSLERKVQEVLLALWLEQHYSKNEILEMYLNRVYLGAGAYGVDAAARRYFGKSAHEVTLFESAILAGLLKAPSRYSPARNLELAKKRAETVLKLMIDVGVITSVQRDEALREKIAIFQTPATGSENYIADWIMDLLPLYVSAVNEDIIVETTVDPVLQLLGEAALQGGLDSFGNKFKLTEGALVVLDTFGAVKGLIGGRDYHRSPYNRAISARRQPGSAFKVFVYLAAIEAGLTSDSIRMDEPIRIGNWSPQNFSKSYQGPVDLKEAFSKSINTIAVQLIREVGVRKVVHIAERLGISSPIQSNASLALGTSEVGILEIANAYVPFSNGGYGTTPHIISRIRSKTGHILFERKSRGIGSVIAPKHLLVMREMMEESLISGTARQARLPWLAGVKTGTSQDFRDAWCIGYSDDLVAAVWLGNDDSSPGQDASGGKTAARVWQRFMLDAHRARPPDFIGRQIQTIENQP